MEAARNIDLRKYIGRDYEKYNCFDLVKEFYLEFFGLELKNYYEGKVPDRREVSNLIVSNKGDFKKIEGRLQFGDLVLIRMFGMDCHIGVYISPETFLHSTKGIGSCLEHLSRYKHLISGYYRHD